MRHLIIAFGVNTIIYSEIMRKDERVCKCKINLYALVFHHLHTICYMLIVRLTIALTRGLCHSRQVGNENMDASYTVD